MNKKRVLGIFIVALTLILAVCLFAACDDDYKVITFDTDGGTAIQPIRAAAGETIIPPADPQKDGFAFEGWTAERGGDVVQLPTVMPSANQTYYAKWVESNVASYRVEYLLENEDGDDFEVDDARTQLGEGEVGSEVTIIPVTIEHMTFLPERSSSRTVTLASGENIIRFYYAREDVKITFKEGDGKDGVIELTAKYGKELTLPDADYELSGKLFVGWGAQANASYEDISVPGATMIAQTSATLYAQFGTAHKYAFGDSKVVTSEAGSDGKCVALYIDEEGNRAWGIADGVGANSAFQAGEFKGAFNSNGTFRENESGKYVEYVLAKSGYGAQFGELELNLDGLTAVYTTSEGEKSGTYRWMTSSGDLTGELELTISGSDPIRFRFKDVEDVPDGYKGCFMKKGAEEGDYEVIADVTQLSTEYVYKVHLDGYGQLTFPLKILNGGLYLAYGNYCGADAEKGIWNFVFDGFIEGVDSDTIYASGGYRDCRFVLKDAVKRVNGQAVETVAVFMREIPFTEGTFAGEGDDSLKLDGFGSATLTEGGQQLAALYKAAGFGAIECLMTKSGERRYFRLDTQDGAYVEVDGSAGSYALGEFTAELSGITPGASKGDMQLTHRGRVIAEGAYSRDGAYALDEYKFEPTWVDFLYPMINGIAVGEFFFKLSGDEFVIRNETIYGSYELAEGGELDFDGYGNVTISGNTYSIEARVSDTVIVNGQGYILDRANRTAKLATKLTGEYYTAVDEYIGPGKLAFDGNGIAQFYNMVNGGYSGQGSYTYDPETGIGEFIPEPNADMTVERFKFILTSATDQHGMYYEHVYYKYNRLGDITLRTDEFTLELGGYGYFTDNYSEAAENYYELTFFGEGAKYVNAGQSLSLENGAYTIRYTDFDVNKVNNMAQYMLDNIPQNYTIEVVFGEEIYNFIIENGAPKVVGSEYGQYCLYSYEFNLADTEVFVSLDGYGNARYWKTRKDEGETSYADYRGTYTVNGEDIHFVSEKQADGNIYEMTFRLMTVELAGGQGTMRLFHRYSEDRVIDAKEYLDNGTFGEATLKVNGYGDVNYTDSEGNVKTARCDKANLDNVRTGRVDDNGDDIWENRLLVRFGDDDLMMFQIEYDMGLGDAFRVMGVEAQEYRFYDGSPNGNSERRIILDGFGNFMVKTPLNWLETAIVATGTYTVDPDDESLIHLNVINVVEEHRAIFEERFPDINDGIVIGSAQGSVSMNYYFAWVKGFKTVYTLADGRTITRNGFTDTTVSGFEGVDPSFVVNFEKKTIGGMTVYELRMQTQNGRRSYVYYFKESAEGENMLEQLVIEGSLE